MAPTRPHAVTRLLLSGRRASLGGQLIIVDEIGRSEDEHLAHDVGMLLIAAHEPDHPPPCRFLDDGLEALTRS